MGIEASGHRHGARGLRRQASAACSRWRQLRATPLGRDFAWILALKGVLLAALYVFVFRPAFHPRQDPGATAGAIAGVAADPPHEVTR